MELLDRSVMIELDTVASNCFGLEIDEKIKQRLVNEPNTFSRHAGWDFNAIVYFKDGKFYSEVWVYRAPRGVYSNEDLLTLCREVNDKYGDR